MSILDSFKHLGTQIRLSLLKVAFNLYNHILIPHSPLFIHDFFHHTDVLFSLPLFRSFGHGYEGFFFFFIFGGFIRNRETRMPFIFAYVSSTIQGTV